ncbi:MAG: hypothetical protein SV760_06940 [Halobacteria archaeon]|nr:hypothetical protein [Halobacteria archaeon]
MSSPTVDRWSRRFVSVSVVYPVVWQTATLLGFPRRSLVSLGLLGFVLHMVFGKAYTLVPSYFDSELSFPSALGIHLPLSSVGTLLIALGGA